MHETGRVVRKIHKKLKALYGHSESLTSGLLIECGEEKSDWFVGNEMKFGDCTIQLNIKQSLQGVAIG